MEKILIEMSGELKCVAEAVESLASRITAFRSDVLAGGAVDYRALEADVAARTAEIERAAHIATLEALEVTRG